MFVPIEAGLPVQTRFFMDTWVSVSTSDRHPSESWDPF